MAGQILGHQAISFRDGEAPDTSAEPIAIVGIGCRFPGDARDPGRFWALLQDGIDAVGEMPPGRFDIDEYHSPIPATPGKVASRWGGFLRDIDQFDAGFFGIAPREASVMDPQQRLLLETAWEALDDAGLSREQTAGSSTGVFIGIWTGDYESQLFHRLEDIDLYATTGGGRYAASGRVSYALDLRGPSLTIDTACSSSLVAVHLACRSLRAGESSLALAGGVNLIIEPHISVGYSRSRLLSPDGRCKFGDARANGYVRSEGCGVVVLKRMADALRDGDPIYAFIRGSAVNNDGQGSGHLVQPALVGQIAMLREAYAQAGVHPANVRYVEAHGTGTAAGDPVELEALGTVLGAGRAEGNYFTVGSVKTNIGHTEAASGMAGLIKAALALKNRALPASLHFETPNPSIPWDRLPLRMQDVLAPWPEGEGPLVAGVNSFGITGTNAHVVLQEAPVRSESSGATGENLLALLSLSAHDRNALAATARAFQSFVAEVRPPIGDLCLTAGARRTQLPERLTLVVGSHDEVVAGLDAYLQGVPHNGLHVGRMTDEALRVAFVFSGQGSQWLGMARELLETAPAFRDALAQCDAMIQEEAGWSVLAELAADPDAHRLEEIDIIQPTLFAVQVALAALWRSWGVVPAAVVGHSMGEVAAAHVAGALSLAEAAAVICRRSRLLRRVRGQGAMAVIDLGIAETRVVLAGFEDRLAVAVNNGPRSTVVSGDPVALDVVLRRLQDDDIFCRPVKVDVASHSPQMDPLLDDLREALCHLAPQPTTVPIYSTVLGSPVDGHALDADYWARNLRQPVLFAEAVERLLDHNVDAFIEVSPHPVLLSAIQQVMQYAEITGLTLPSLRRSEPERATLLDSLGALAVRGQRVDWRTLLPTGRHLHLPTYPWQRERFWFEESDRRQTTRLRAGANDSSADPPLGIRLPDLAHLPNNRFWQGQIAPSSSDAECLQVSGVPVLSGTAAIAIGWMTATSNQHRSLVGLTIEEQPLLTEALETQTIESMCGDRAELQLFIRAASQESWTRWATLHAAITPPLPPITLVVTIQERLTRQDPPTPGYTEVWYGSGESLARLALATAQDQEWTSLIDRSVRLLDAPAAGATNLFAGAESAALYGDLNKATWVHVCRHESSETTGDIHILDVDGAVLAELRGVVLRKPDEELLRRIASLRLHDLTYTASWQPIQRDGGARTRTDGTWLILTDGGGLGGQLAVSLEATGGRAQIISAETSNAESLLARITEIVGDSRPSCAGIIDLRALAQEGADLPIAAERCCERALILAQTIAQIPWGNAPQLWLITRGTRAIDGPPHDVAGAGLWGLGRVIGAEHPELWGGLIDLDSSPMADEAEALCATILASDGEDEIALRGTQRLAARLKRLRLPEVQPKVMQPLATYMITGGAGGLGLAVADWMVEAGARHLVLVGRSPLGVAASARVAELQASGAQVRYLQGDIALQDDVDAIFATIARELPPLRGVVHAAGVLADAALTGQTRAGLQAVMAPKIAGAWNLAKVCDALPLDFLVFFSSASALLGTPGQGNYAAANEILDAFAQCLRASNMSVTSIAWGPWADIGLATTVDRGENLDRLGLVGLDPTTGLAALERLVGTDLANLAVFDISWPTFLTRGKAAGRFAEMIEGMTVCQVPTVPIHDTALRERLTETAPEDRSMLLLEQVRGLVAAILRFNDLQRVPPGLGFFQMGMDSLTAVELKNRLQQSLNLTLLATVAFDYPTPLALTQYLLAELFPVSRASISSEPDYVEPDKHVQLSRDELRDLLEDELQALDEELVL